MSAASKRSNARKQPVAKTDAKAETPARKTRKEQAAETKARLKEATRTVLDRIGYRQMRVADIAAEAGVAVGLFYHYFSDIKTVTCEVLADFLESVMSEARNAPRTGEPFETLRGQYLVFIENFEKHSGLMRCMLQVSDEILEFGEIWQSANRQWTERFAQNLSESLGAKPADHDMVVLMAYCLSAMYDGVMHAYFVQRNPELVKRAKSKRELAELLALLTYRAIVVANPPREKLTTTLKLANLSASFAGTAEKAAAAKKTK